VKPSRQTSLQVVPHYIISIHHKGKKINIECLHSNNEFYLALCFVLSLTFLAIALVIPVKHIPYSNESPTRVERFKGGFACVVIIAGAFPTLDDSVHVYQTWKMSITTFCFLCVLGLHVSISALVWDEWSDIINYSCLIGWFASQSNWRLNFPSSLRRNKGRFCRSSFFGGKVPINAISVEHRSNLKILPVG